MTDFGLKGVWAPSDGADWATHRRRLIDRLPPTFSTIWLSDHLQLDGRAWGEAWTRLTWLAATFPSLRVGPMVLCQSLRNPGLLGVMAATLQDLSRGRVIVGLGAGWLEEEYRAFNYQFPSPGARVEQLAETIEILRALWSGTPTTYEGKHYRLDGAIGMRPDLPIPIMVGTNGPRALKTVARLADAWVWDGPWDLTYREPYERLKQECVQIGRPFEEIILLSELAVWMPDDASAFEPTYENIGYPGLKFGIAGPKPDDVIREIETLVDAGVKHIAFNVEDEPTFDRLINEVVPAVRLQPVA